MEAPFQKTVQLSMSFLLLQHIITLFCNYIFSKPSVWSARLRALQGHGSNGPYISSSPQQPAQILTQSEHSINICEMNEWEIVWMNNKWKTEFKIWIPIFFWTKQSGKSKNHSNSIFWSHWLSWPVCTIAWQATTDISVLEICCALYSLKSGPKTYSPFNIELSFIFYASIFNLPFFQILNTLFLMTIILLKCAIPPIYLLCHFKNIPILPIFTDWYCSN